ncbi:TetR family transcriptional regulator [Longimycelium tulufanense]|uniref:TetR family transcriptional regulator n=1 Tax=Longimycelium tulufanense TaxID=907463 RepID=A0A8J3CDY8_9PSEU|nr:TetR/AcrR family transcriptional regulator [Longimycelium tulufanense]GGM60215.1 TetR family transcriptional regulator [Longimycelium tulufanense]
MPYRRTPAVQARLDALRAGILAAATAQIAEHGYAGCIVAAVARRAGVATGTVYRHFPAKADLLAEVFRSVVTREVAAVAEAARRPTGTLTERITAVVETFAGRALKAPRLAYALLAEPVDPAVDTERLAFREAFRDVIATAVAEGVRTGHLPPQNARLTAAALVGAIGEALVGPLAAGTPDVDTLPALVTFSLRALGVPDAHP